MQASSSQGESFCNEDLRLRQSFSEPHACQDHGPTASFLSGASGFRMRDIQYIEASHVTVNTGRADTGNELINDGWKLLLKNASPNALYNSGAQHDSPGCDENTRIEVIDELMGFIEDRDNHPQRLLCMTGAAGSGKSALQQTIAERCENSGTLLAAHFLSAVDPTRNTVATIVPTIAFQVGSRNLSLKHLISAVVAQDPFIFRKSLQTQMDTLIVGPFRKFRDCADLDINTFPSAILIDGLDECKGEALQAELLTAIRLALLADDLPFRIFIASRPEMAIRTALEPGGHLHGVAIHLPLSDKYYAAKDMCRYLQRRFHGLSPRVGDPLWFTEKDINTLVKAASGQFIYVATAFKYISEPRGSPMDRLKIVLTWTPHGGQMARPFEALDRLYTNILLNAKEAYEAVDTHRGRDFLLLFRIYQLNSSQDLSFTVSPDILNSVLDLESNATQILISDLRSLVTLECGSRLREYHKSFYDFLDEDSRAKDLFVPIAHVYAHLAKCQMQNIMKYTLELDSFNEWEELMLSGSHKEILWEAVTHLGLSLKNDRGFDDEIVSFTQKGGWRKIDKLFPPAHRKALKESQAGDVSKCHTGLACLSRVPVYLKNREPETAAVLSKYLAKWIRDINTWSPANCNPKL
ncbi:hypothetical protein EST38_g11393 [Candolleomyces aberdarensis]|uniref:Nephrocystin 3-like N-terminal domain-containing protein n=1 Tax=Candolleomyces aberdarensis TaxID=2316362 RepID=A0A4Q2D4Z3_9AGAR|nr:hypothetical protein EST38_g11393 [Candolleomyces aberdarensis]